MTHILDGRQPETNCMLMWCEVRITHVDIWRFDRNAHVSALIDVLHHVVRVSGHRRQQRRHELHRIMSLQIRRLIRQYGVGRRVRLVEAVSGELLHQVEDLFDLLLRELPFQRALHEALALLRHLLSVLLPHRAPQQVGFTERISR